MSNPLLLQWIHTLSYLALLVAVRLIFFQSVGILNTVITPAKFTSDPPLPHKKFISKPAWEVI